MSPDALWTHEHVDAAVVEQQLFPVIYSEQNGVWAEITHGAATFVVFHTWQLILHDPIQSSNLTFIHN